jgi:hypothetical protein
LVGVPGQVDYNISPIPLKARVPSFSKPHWRHGTSAFVRRPPPLENLETSVFQTHNRIMQWGSQSRRRTKKFSKPVRCDILFSVAPFSQRAT